MTLIRLNTRHFRRQKNILYNIDQNSLIFQGYVVDRCTTLIVAKEHFFTDSQRLAMLFGLALAFSICPK